MDSDPGRGMGRLRASGYGLVSGLCLSGLLVAGGVWLVVIDTPTYRFVVRLFGDKPFLREVVETWGVLTPVLFIALQALHVILSPIPGEATGLLGGYLFGERLGFFYSTIGLTLGSLASFGVGRLLGANYVRGLVRQQTWDKLGFVIESEGGILCFIIYLMPGLPKDIASYLFGISPLPFWVFAVASTLGRIPGTWVLSAQGAHTASGNYLHVIVLTAIAVAVALPLYYYRNRIVAWLARSATSSPTGQNPRSGDTSMGS
ncbi:MAG: hypothetical protein DMD98_18720 [Candidatus Rokuibacteriota bacterium]|nr:MAG: hypothetical protein DMD98_18720 [Candidatus Rokubacteria bacterium]